MLWVSGEPGSNMRIVPQDEVLQKLAAIQSADVLGRMLAQDKAIEKLASAAGAIFAHSVEEEDMEKLATSMLYSGELTPYEYEMLKEAGFVGKLVKGVVRKAKTRAAGAAQSASKAMSNVKSNVKARVRRPTPVSKQSRDWGTPGNVAPARTPKPKAKAKPSPNQSRDWGGQTRQPVSNAEYNRRASWGARQGQMRPSTPAPGSVRAATPPPQASGQVRSTTQTAAPRVNTPAAHAPTMASGQVRAATPPPGQVKSAPSQQRVTQVSQNTAPVSNTATQTGKAVDAPKSPSSWGRVMPWLGVGGLGYGLYKGVPWAAQQLERTSTSPMAYGGGWSPVPYGYGYNPYGPSTPTMGSGA